MLGPWSCGCSAVWAGAGCTVAGGPESCRGRTPGRGSEERRLIVIVITFFTASLLEFLHLEEGGSLEVGEGGAHV